MSSDELVENEELPQRANNGLREWQASAPELNQVCPTTVVLLHAYYTNDLVLLDWIAAIICERDYDDTVQVLELLNVELLEARNLDARLDTRIAEYAKLIQQRTEWLFSSAHLIKKRFRNSQNYASKLRS